MALTKRWWHRELPNAPGHLSTGLQVEENPLPENHCLGALRKVDAIRVWIKCTQLGFVSYGSGCKQEIKSLFHMGVGRVLRDCPEHLNCLLIPTNFIHSPIPAFSSHPAGTDACFESYRRISSAKAPGPPCFALWPHLKPRLGMQDHSVTTKLNVQQWLPEEGQSHCVLVHLGEGEGKGGTMSSQTGELCSTSLPWVLGSP